MSVDPSNLADANLLQSIREYAAWQSPHELVERDGLLLMAGSSDFPSAVRNCVARVDPSVPASVVLERAAAFFAERRRGFTIYVRASRDADLETVIREKNCEQRSDSPCMVIERPTAEREPPPDIRIEAFEQERHIRDATRVNAEAYEAIGFPASQTHALFARPDLILARKPIGFVAYRGELPVATAMIMASANHAGVYWVGTTPAAQRAGLGTLCTALATNAAFAAGAAAVTLQATPFGEPVYRRLGYETCDRLRWYRYPAPAG